MSENYCLTVKDIYGAPLSELTAPEGWEFTGEFRPPQPGDDYLSSTPRSIMPETKLTASHFHTLPSLILRRLAAQRTVESVYGKPFSQIQVGPPDSEKWELTGEFRAPKKGERWLHPCSVVGTVEASDNYPEESTYLICRLKAAIGDVYSNGDLQDWRLHVERNHPEYYLTGEFRKPMNNESVLAFPGGTSVVDIGERSASVGGPRLIAKKKPTIEEVYGKPLAALKAPDGWELTGEFEAVKKGKNYLLPFYTHIPQKYEWDCPCGFRLVIRKLPSIIDIYGAELKDLRAPDGYEFTGEFRQPKPGEMVLSDLALDAFRWRRCKSSQHRLILRKTTTVRDIYGADLEQLTPPSGYQFTGEFRVPCGRDVYLLRSVRSVETSPDDPMHQPRLILEKLPVTPTIREVYGTPNPVIPKGWKFKEFRELTVGENVSFISHPRSSGRLELRHKFNGFPVGTAGWRIVVEPDATQFTKTVGVEEVYGGPVTIPPGYRTVRFDYPNAGELYYSKPVNGAVMQPPDDYSRRDLGDLRLILKRL